jgi:hypothetical protein
VVFRPEPSSVPLRDYPNCGILLRGMTFQHCPQSGDFAREKSDLERTPALSWPRSALGRLLRGPEGLVALRNGEQIRRLRAFRYVAELRSGFVHVPFDDII